MIVGNTQLGEGAQHAFRRLTAQFSRFNFEITRQYRTHGCHGDFQALTAVWRTANDVQQAVAADIHFCHAQFVGVRMLAALDHFTDHDAGEGTGNRLNAVNFQARHGDLVRQRVAVQRGIDPFA
ncbi:Uncharacterised protein [Enterobacter kobei]|nr:Uncharacterised protein [Enterobacter kobei]